MAKAYHLLSPEEQTAKFDRLPAWARERLQRTSRDLAFAQSELDALRRGRYGPANSPVQVDPYDDQPINLPPTASIEFRLSDTDNRKIVRVRILKDGMLDINANGALWLNPRASNSVEISVGDQ